MPQCLLQRQTTQELFNVPANIACTKSCILSGPNPDFSAKVSASARDSFTVRPWRSIALLEVLKIELVHIRILCNKIANNCFRISVHLSGTELGSFDLHFILAGDTTVLYNLHMHAFPQLTLPRVSKHAESGV